MHLFLKRYGFWIIALHYVLRSSFLVDDPFHLAHDNFGYHFFGFTYMANSLLHGFGIPRILLDWGGSELAMSAISMGYFAPHRMFAYILYALSSLGPLYCFKVGILFGFIVNGYGWHLLWRRVLPSEFAALFCTLLFFCSGIGITIWHQEQVLDTLSYLPWTLLFAVMAFRDQKALPLAAACAGGLLTLHYPQIHLVALSFLAGLIFYLYKPKCSWSYQYIILALLAFLLSIAPSIYIWSKHQDYGSPIRLSAALLMETLEEYWVVNWLQRSSAEIAYFANLFWPSTNNGDDQAIFFISFVGLFFCVGGLFYGLIRNRHWQWLSLFTIFLAWCAFGIHGGLAQLLYLVKFPMIAAFRQWYHFSPYLILAMVTLAGVGFWRAQEYLAARKASVLWSKFALLLVLFTPLESFFYYNFYLQRFRPEKTAATARYSKEEFLRAFNQGELKIPADASGNVALLALRTSLSFYSHCPEARQPVLRVWDSGSLSPASEQAICTNLKNKSMSTVAQFTPIGLQLLQPIGQNQALAVSLNTSFLKNASPAIELTPLAGGAMSVLTTKQATYHEFAGSGFALTLALQCLVLFASVLIFALSRITGESKILP